MSMLKFYESCFTLLGLRVDDSGAVLVSDGVNDTPFTVKGKALYLPVEKALRAKPGSTYNFHPLLEDVVRNESIILQEYRRSAMALVNLNLLTMVGDLITIAASADMQKGLIDPKQHEITSVLKGASDNTKKAFNRLLGNFPEGKDTHCKLIKMNIRKNGKHGDQNVRAVAVITSPFMEELEENKLSLPEKHIKIIKAAVLYVMPGLDVDGTWNCGSNSQYAPMYHATLTALWRFYSRITELDQFFASAKIGDLVKATNLFDVVNVAPYVDGHVAFDELRAEAKRIPMQLGNEGQSEGNVAPTVAAPEERRRDASAALRAAASVEPKQVVETPKQALPATYREETKSEEQAQPKKFGSYQEAVRGHVPTQTPGRIIRRDEYGNELDPETNLPYGVTVEEIVPSDPREKPYLIYVKNGHEVDPENGYRPIRGSRRNHRDDDRGRYRDDRRYDDRRDSRFEGRYRDDYDDRRRDERRYDDRHRSDRRDLRPGFSVDHVLENRRGEVDYFATLEAITPRDDYDRRR